jgi:hypothetical protein
LKEVLIHAWVAFIGLMRDFAGLPRHDFLVGFDLLYTMQDSLGDRAVEEVGCDAILSIPHPPVPCQIQPCLFNDVSKSLVFGLFSPQGNLEVVQY